MVRLQSQQLTSCLLPPAVHCVQYYGQVQYMESSAVTAAVSAANGTRWMGAVIQVVAHHRAGQADRWGWERASVPCSRLTL